MLKIKCIKEIIFEPMLKVRGITSNNNYFEIRFKNGFLDVRTAISEGEYLRCIYREEISNNEKIDMKYVINRLGLIFE